MIMKLERGISLTPRFSLNNSQMYTGYATNNINLHAFVTLTVLMMKMPKCITLN